MYYVENNELKRVQGDIFRIGGTKLENKNFKNTILNIQQKDTVFYFASDGYIDQNNHLRKKLGNSLFQECLLENSKAPLKEQKNILLQVLNNHQKEEEQRDDITIVGLKI
jgi:serine phosphatase RsbU (regulator of sigma subunit)